MSMYAPRVPYHHHTMDPHAPRSGPAHRMDLRTGQGTQIPPFRPLLPTAAPTPTTAPSDQNLAASYAELGLTPVTMAAVQENPQLQNLVRNFQNRQNEGNDQGQCGTNAPPQQ